MRILLDSQVDTIEWILGRKLTSEDVEPSAALPSLSAIQIGNAQKLVSIAGHPITIAYLSEIVEGVSMRSMVSFIVRVVEGGADPAAWKPPAQP